MKASIRSVVAAIFLTAVIGLTSACTLALIDGSGPSTQPDRLTALMRYVALERATIPQIEQMHPGVFSEIEFEGRIDHLDGSTGIAAGEYATIWYYFTFADELDWDITSANLDEERAAFDELCQDELFAALELLGVTGLKSAVWTYTDDYQKPAQMWSHRCAGE